MARLRAEEQRTIWGADANADGQLALARTFPGMMFGMAKERMEATRLWRVVKAMPKGALLHAHLDAMVDVRWLVETVLATPGMCMVGGEGGGLGGKEERGRGKFTFRYGGKGKGKQVSIWDARYRAGDLIAAEEAADSFPDGGRRGFVEWVRERCTITVAESIEHHHGVDHVWEKFASCFPILNSMIFYEPIWRQFLRRMFRHLLDDGVRWVELRQAFPFSYYSQGERQPDATFDGLFRVFEEELAAFKASDNGKAFWGATIIWTSIRAFDQRAIIEDMDACITAKLAFPNIISGYDLVGLEDAGRPLKDLLPELFWFRKQCAEEGVEIPFFFHAGETLGDGSDADQNIFDAILLGTRRIGHGYSLYKHPLLIDMVKERRILVESCPVSNEVLRLCSSVLSHPLPALLARGVSCALSNDDPAILGQDTSGMTHDFWQALQGWENLGLAGLGSLAENSIRWSAFEEENAASWAAGVKEASLGSGRKADRLKEWAVEWEKYCLWIVTEFGEDGPDRESMEALSKETHFDTQD